MYDTKKNSEFDRLLKSRIQLFEGRAEAGATEAAKRRNEIRKEKARKASLKNFYKYHEEYKAKNREKARKWRKKYPEKQKEANKKWNETHKETRRALNNMSYRRHAEELNLKKAIRKHKENPNARFRGKNARLYGSIEAMEKRLAEIMENKKCTTNK